MYASRINVIGTSGCGKSTFSKQLSELLQLPYVQIDQVYWKPQWTEPTDVEFSPKLESAIAGDRWVLDGNYPLFDMFRRACRNKDSGGFAICPIANKPAYTSSSIRSHSHKKF
jgi:adenylate kinase family enzyme